MGEGATAGVKAAMRGSGRNAPMMGHMQVSIHVHRSCGGEVGQVSCGGDFVNSRCSGSVSGGEVVGGGLKQKHWLIEEHVKSQSVSGVNKSGL